MNQSARPAEMILEDLLSQDSERIWYASCEIIHLGQERTRIQIGRAHV